MKTRSRWFKDVTVNAHGSARSGATTRRHHGRRRCRHWRHQDRQVDEDGKPTVADAREVAVWKRRDTKASAIIGLTLGSEQLQHVAGCKTTAEMWSTLQGVFLRKSLMNKM